MAWITLAVFACGGDQPEPPLVHPKTVPAPLSDIGKAAAIAKGIDADASNAEALVKAHGLSEEQYRALLYQIAADPKKSAEFVAARR
jgi:hypothetical protein